MRPLRFSINLTLDACCDLQAGSPDPDLHHYRTQTLAHADALIFGRDTYQMMESAWRPAASGVWPDWMTDWMLPFARTINAPKKYASPPPSPTSKFPSGAVALRYEPRR